MHTLTVDDTKCYVITNVFQGKRSVVPVTPREEGKLCSLILPYKNDCHRTTKAAQGGKYFTELSKESDDPEQQVGERVKENVVPM